jgi:hypothetical protein
VEVMEEENRVGFLKFLDNYVALTIEEGEIEPSEIVENLQALFDKKCHWQLREIEEFKYLVRFPPHKQVSATLISDTTYFKLKKEGVLVSLKAWSGDIEPHNSLDLVWVQIRGVPPKWSNWKCFRQIASSLGKIVEIDWSSLFSSFFSMVRVRIACKDPTRIPGKRLFEMDNNFYVIHFKVEKTSELGKEDGNDDGKDEENGDHEEDSRMEEFQHHSESEDKRSSGGAGQDKHSSNQGKSGSGQGFGGTSGSAGRGSSSRKVSAWASMFQIEEENVGLDNSELGQYSCTKLLKEMEALDSDGDDEIVGMAVDDAKMVHLLEVLCADLDRCKESTDLPTDIYTLPNMISLKQNVEDEIANREKRKGGKQKWGSVLVEPRPSRGNRDGRTILEKAQNRKKRSNLEEPKGLSHNPFSILSIADISEIAQDTGVVLGKNTLEKDRSLLEII